MIKTFANFICKSQSGFVGIDWLMRHTNLLGEDLAERGAQETSSVVVETVQKVSKSKTVGPVLPLFKSDASKVTSKGMGLKKAYLQKQNMFTVHAGDAGEFLVTLTQNSSLTMQMALTLFHLQATTFFTLECMALKAHVKKYSSSIWEDITTKLTMLCGRGAIT